MTEGDVGYVWIEKFKDTKKVKFISKLESEGGKFPVYTYEEEIGTRRLQTSSIYPVCASKIEALYEALQANNKVEKDFQNRIDSIYRVIGYITATKNIITEKIINAEGGKS